MYDKIHYNIKNKKKNKKTAHAITIRLSNYSLGHLSQRNENYVHAKICSGMFMVALFVIAWTPKQPKCFSMGKWLSKQWYIHSIEYDSGIKKEQALDNTQQLG